MTAPPGDNIAVPQITPAPGSRLEQLLAMRESAQAALKDASDRVTAIEAGIMTDAAAMYPGCGVIDIAAAPGRPGLRLRWHEGSWYVPAGTLRKKYLGVWEELKERQKGHWQLHKLEG